MSVINQPSSVSGVWNLHSFEKQGPGGPRLQPYGKKPQGMLLYTPDGFVFASLADGEREKLEVAMEVLAKPGLKGFGKRLQYAKAAARSISYAGRYSIQGSEIWHDVSVSSFPDWVGTRLVRDFSLEAGALTLTFTDSLGATSKLVWRRAV